MTPTTARTRDHAKPLPGQAIARYRRKASTAYSRKWVSLSSEKPPAWTSGGCGQDVTAKRKPPQRAAAMRARLMVVIPSEARDLFLKPQILRPSGPQDDRESRASG